VHLAKVHIRLKEIQNCKGIHFIPQKLLGVCISIGGRGRDGGEGWGEGGRRGEGWRKEGGGMEGGGGNLQNAHYVPNFQKIVCGQMQLLDGCTIGSLHSYLQ
jgi:hypothetical protein